MASRVALAVTYHDPDGHMTTRLATLLPRTLACFDGATALCSAVAPPEGRALLATLGVDVRDASDPATGVDVIGRARREAVLRAAIAHDAEVVVYSDIDHIARWCELEPAELADALVAATHDLTVFGRTPTVLHALPPPLAMTEAIINRVFAEVSGRSWDLLSGVRALSRRAIDEIVATDTEDTAANDVTWPLRSLRAGLDVHYSEARGLDYEDQRQFGDPADVDAFRRRMATDTQQWLLRLRIAQQMVDAIARAGTVTPDR